MERTNEFTEAEAMQIEALLKEKCASTRERQKSIRYKLRRSMNFYITDFKASNDGYTVDKFREDIKNGKIRILK